MSSRSNILRIGLAIGLTAVPAAAFAHPSIGPAQGFAPGFIHPLQGADHVIVMIAVGMIAARMGGWALGVIPCAFLTMMAVGGFLGMQGAQILFVETGILLSVAVFGLAVCFNWKVPTALAVSVTGFVAVLHGHAHGSEMAAGASWPSYASGFIIATALLHLVGIGVGLGIEQKFQGTSKASLR